MLSSYKRSETIHREKVDETYVMGAGDGEGMCVSLSMNLSFPTLQSHRVIFLMKQRDYRFSHFLINNQKNGDDITENVRKTLRSSIIINTMQFNPKERADIQDGNDAIGLRPQCSVCIDEWSIGPQELATLDVEKVNGCSLLSINGNARNCPLSGSKQRVHNNTISSF